jgi:hypothetical protein
MAKFSSIFDWTIFLIIDSLLLVSLSILLRRKLHGRLFFFTSYLIVSVISDIGWRWRTLTWPYPHIRFWYFVYWSVEFLLSVLRLLTFAQICRQILRKYPTVYAATSVLLMGLGAVLLFWTAYPTIRGFGGIWPLVIIGDQRFALTQTVLLLAFLAIGSYYRMQIPPLYWFILVGIGVYSTLQIANNELLAHQLFPSYSVADYIRRASIVISVAIWTYAVARWSGAPEQKSQLIPQITYDNFSSQLHDKMQEFNDRLADLFSKRQ